MDRSTLQKQWHTGIRICHTQHCIAATHNAKMHKYLGVPVVVIGTVVGTSVFASLDATPEPWIKIIVGILSVCSAILAALQTFMGYSDLTEKHKTAAVKYGILRRELEQFMSIQKDNNEADNGFYANFRKEWDAADSEAPSTPQDIHDRAVKHVSSKNNARDKKYT